MEKIYNPINKNFETVLESVNIDEVRMAVEQKQSYFKNWGIVPIARIYLLNEDETIKLDISRDVSNFDVSVTYQIGQRRNLNITMVNVDNKWSPKFNTGLVQIGSKFRLDLGFICKKIAYWKQMGVFLLKDPNMTRETSNQTISFSLCDKFGLFDGTISGKSGLREIIPVDVPMYQAFTTIITSDRGNGVPFDLKPIQFNSKYKNRKTFYTIKQEAGSTLSDLMTKMAETISSDVFYNEFGNLCVQSNVNEFINANLPIAWHFTEDVRDRISFSKSESTSNIVNTIQVKGNIVNGYQFSAVAKNKNPLSPTCVQYRGELFETIQDQTLYSDELCMDRAQYELLARTRGTSTANISCPFLPIWDVNQSVLIDFPTDGINNQMYAIDSFSYSSDNAMNLTLSNINEVIF